MTEIKLIKRYPHSRTEDIVDAYMRGWNDALDAVQNGKFHIAERNETESECNTCKYAEDADEHCELCGIADINNYEPKADRKTEPTGYNLSPVETEPQTFDKPTKCLGCLYSDLDKAFHPCASCVDFGKYVGEESGKDEPQTDCPWR